jgi:hypothetical protein
MRGTFIGPFFKLFVVKSGAAAPFKLFVVKAGV